MSNVRHNETNICWLSDIVKLLSDEWNRHKATVGYITQHMTFILFTVNFEVEKIDQT